MQTSPKNNVPNSGGKIVQEGAEFNRAPFVCLAPSSFGEHLRHEAALVAEITAFFATRDAPFDTPAMRDSSANDHA
jgi:hypothetical protein